MNLEQYLLTKLAEELREVGEPVGKAIIFGVQDVNPKNRMTNEQSLSFEFIDVLVVMDALESFGIIIPFARHQLLENKWRHYYLRKVEKFVHYTFVSESLGRTTITAAESAKLIDWSAAAKREADLLESHNTDKAST